MTVRSLRHTGNEKNFLKDRRQNESYACKQSSATENTCSCINVMIVIWKLKLQRRVFQAGLEAVIRRQKNVDRSREATRFFVQILIPHYLKMSLFR